MRGRHAVMGALVAAVAVFGPATAAAAHPLGNFTVNRYARVEVSAGVVRVYYVLDEAEIPAFQERDAVAADREAFADRRARAIAANLSLVLDGARVPLEVDARDLSQPQGQGGLPTLRLAVRYRAAVPAGAAVHTLALEDGNEPDRVGWREIVVTARGGGRILGTDAPTTDRTDELRSYPADLVRSPLDLRRATLTFTPGTEEVPALPLAPPAAAPSRAGGRFADLVTRSAGTPWALAGLLAIALLVGAAHALAPGHGKTVMAAYLVGTRGRPRDALLLGTIVSLMHTGSVLALGLLLFHVSRTTRLDRIYPVLTLAGGLVVVVVGAVLLRGRLRTLRHERAHAHGHPHGHGHSHAHDLPAGVSPLSRRGLVVLAGAGGVVPSPSAVIVLVSAFALHRVGLGLALVAAFSVGLAATLTAVGLAFVLGRDVLARHGTHWLRRLPAAGATALVLMGSAVALQGLRGL